MQEDISCCTWYINQLNCKSMDRQEDWGKERIWESLTLCRNSRKKNFACQGAGKLTGLGVLLHNSQCCSASLAHTRPIMFYIPANIYEKSYTSTLTLVPIMQSTPMITTSTCQTGPSFSSESVHTLFFNVNTGCAQKIWSGDKTSTWHGVRYMVWSCGRFLIGLSTLILQREFWPGNTTI